MMVTAEWLANSELFAGLKAGQLKAVAGLCRETTLPGESVVFEESSEARTIYILQDGEVALRVTAPRAADSTRVSAALQPGAVFGWSALVVPARYTATAITTQPSHIVAIDGGALLNLLAEQPLLGFQVMRNLAGVIAGRLRNAYDQISTGTQPGLITQG